MAIKTCTGVTGRPYVHVEVRLSQSATITATGLDAPLVTNATGDVTGAYSITLWANNDLTPNGTYYTVTEYLGTTDNTFTIQVPQTAGPFTMPSILVTAPTASPSPNHVSTLIVDTTAAVGSLTVTAGETGIDTAAAGVLEIGGDNATSVEIGPANVLVDASGNVAARSFTAGNSPYAATLPGDATTATPAGIQTGAVWDYGGEVWNLNAFGAKFDSRAVSDVAITTGTAILTSATAAFTAADVGKLVGIAGAGAAGVALKTTILSYQSATQVTLSVNAGTSVSGASARFATDDGPAMVRALTKMGTTGHILACPSPRYSVGTQVPVTIMRLTVRGTGRTGGCIIDWYGTGSMFELGTDNGQAYDGNYYDGIETFTLEDITIQDPFPTTLLTNGLASYTPGTIAVRDWRGGDQVWKNVTISNFDYPFWGIQSDLNRWDHVKILSCHSGVYQGPRSDQWLAEDCQWYGNDRAIDIDRAQHPKFSHCYFINNGAVGTNPIKIHTAWTFGQWAASFDDCWFEQYLGVAAALEAFIEIGVGDTVQSSQLHIRNPSILTNASGGGPHMQYLVKVGRATHIVIEEPTAQIFGTGAPGTAANIEALVSCVAANSPDILIRLPKSYTAGGSFFTTVATSGGATPNTIVEAWGSSGWQVFTGALTVTGGQATLGNTTLATAPQLTFDSAVAQNRQILFDTASTLRWIIRVDNSAEGGANAGSDFALLARTDAGGALITPIFITRATGLILFGGSIQLNKELRRAKQTPTEAVLVSGVDPTLGELVVVTLTAARVVGAPTSPQTGQRLHFTLIQGGAGAFAVTWNAIFKKTWADTGNATGARSTIAFMYDGSNWNQDGAQAPYV